MPPAARVTDMHVCPMVTGVVPHVGGPILPPCAPTVLIGFLPAARVTDMLTCVGPPDIIVKGSAGVFINFLPAARMGDNTAHGGVIILGEPTVIVGEIGSPSPGAGGAGAIVAGLVAAGAPAAATSGSYQALLSKPGDPGGGSGGGSTPATPAKGGAATPAAGSLPSKKPADCASAPSTVTIPKNVNDSMGQLMKNSFPKGDSQEQGGIIAQDAKGNVALINQKGGDSGTFTPDRTLPAGSKELGLFHTHPYSKAEGGYTGVSFSGADMAIAANDSEPSYVQSGDQQFLVIATDKTPSNIDYTALNNSQNARISELTGKGTEFGAASRIAAKETAQKYGMAYYEGKDGTLTKVSC